MAEDLAFRTALAENMFVVRDSVHAIRDELEALNDRQAALFFGQLATALELFVASWEPGQDRHGATSPIRLAIRRR